jgi:hypothetical protein
MGGWLGASHCLVGVMQRREAHTAPRPVRAARCPRRASERPPPLEPPARWAVTRAALRSGKPRPGQTKAGASHGRGKPGPGQARAERVYCRSPLELIEGVVRVREGIVDELVATRR